VVHQWSDSDFQGPLGATFLFYEAIKRLWNPSSSWKQLVVVAPNQGYKICWRDQLPLIGGFTPINSSPKVFFLGGARFGARLTTFCGLVLPRGIYPYIPKWHRSCEKVASGKLTSLWNITMFNEKINYKSPCSIANC